MKLTVVGSRYFGATVLQNFLRDGVNVVRVVAPAADDRLALAAEKAGIPVHVLANPKIVPEDAVAEGTDLVVAAHTHARVSTRRSRARGSGASAITRRSCRGIAASPRWSGRSCREIPSPAAPCITWPTAGMRAPSRRRTGASSPRARRRASCGSARWRRWD